VRSAVLDRLGRRGRCSHSSHEFANELFT
jgi:hypothetical protein